MSCHTGRLCAQGGSDIRVVTLHDIRWLSNGSLMCGITGTVRPDTDLSGLLEAAGLAQRHRGPDGHAQAQESVGRWRVGFGHQRLAIIDLSEGGVQPMVSPSGGSIVTFNGEIYNYLELKQQLSAEGVRFSSDSDTEVLLAALETWGVERALNSFNGMWAFAWLDRTGRRLVLARDRAGKKPLYWRLTETQLDFASELKALLSLSGGRFALNRQAAFSLLAQSLLHTDEHTMLEGVTTLPQGSYGVVDLGSETLSLEVERYWQAPTRLADPGAKLGEERLAAEVRELFYSAVDLRLRSDVPVGVLLSGGVDSSAIAAAVHNRTAAGQEIAVLSAVSDDPLFDESPHIDAVARHLGAQVHKIPMNLGPDEAFELLERVTWHNDEPVLSFSAVAHYKLMEAAKDLGVTVVLSGQGADELLCGYKKYMFFAAQALVRSGQPFQAAKLLTGSLLAGTVMRQLDLREIQRYLPRLAGKELGSALGPALAGMQRIDLGLRPGMSLQERQALDFDSLSVPLLTHYEDRMSMAHGREIRLPFLDYRLVEKLIPLPGEWKVRGGWTKYIFRKAIERDLPHSIVWRKDKKAFALPQSVWLRHQLKDKVLELFEPGALVFEHGLLDRERFLERYSVYVGEGERRGRVWYREIFAAISLELWLRRYQEWLTRP